MQPVFIHQRNNLRLCPTILPFISILLCFFFASSVHAQVNFDTLINTPNPVHFWKLQETALPLVDSAGSLDITLSSGMTFSQQALISAYPASKSILGASSGIVGATSSGAYNFPGGNLSASLFFRTNGLHDVMSPVVNTGAYVIRANTVGVNFQYYSGGVLYTATFTTLTSQHNKNYHLILRVSGTEAAVTLNGKTEKQTLVGTIDAATAKTVTIGRRAMYVSYVSLYHSALSFNQMTGLLRSARGIDSEENLVAAATGSETAAATYADPLELHFAASAELLIGYGKKLYIKGGRQSVGTHWGGVIFSASGTPSSPITIESYPGETAALDGFELPLGTYLSSYIVQMKGEYLRLVNLHVTNSNSDAENNRSLTRQIGISISGKHNKIIGCWIYDAGIGIFPLESAEDFEDHGNLLFNNGRFRTDGGTIEMPEGVNPAGHNIYIQNNPSSAAGKKLSKNSVLWGAADFGYHAFGQSGLVRHLEVDGMISFANGGWWRAGRYSQAIAFLALDPMTDITVKDSTVWRGNMVFGRIGDGHERFTVTNNLILSTVSFFDVTGVNFSNNTLVSPTVDGVHGARLLYYQTPRNYAYRPGYDDVNKGYWTGSGNVYAGKFFSAVTPAWHEDGVQSYNLAWWQAKTGIDTNAVMRNLNTHPLSAKIGYRPNEYLAGRGFFYIYNPEMLDSVSVNLSSFGLSQGQAFTIKDVMNPFGAPVASGTYNPASPTISIPMTGTTVHAIIGYTIAGNASDRTSKEFKAFIVESSTQATGCTFTLSATSTNIPASGGNKSFNITTNNSTCSWSAVSNNSWITINSGSNGKGNGTVNFTVAANTGLERIGTITIAGKTFTITQNNGCIYSLSSIREEFLASGGKHSFNVNAGVGCAWTAQSNSSWITVTSSNSGTGNGTVSFLIAENSGFERSGSIPVAGHIFNVSQAGHDALINSTFFDFDGDKKSDLSVFRSSSGGWHLLKSQEGYLTINFGLSTDKLASADYDGDGRTDIAVFRDGTWFILQSQANIILITSFGIAGDAPLPNDWDGDGKADLAVYREGTDSGQSYFYYRGSLNNSSGNITFVPFGLAGDKPVPADYDGDGKTDAAVFRPNNRVWYIHQSSDGQIRFVQFGLAEDCLVPADYDGDRRTDIAVFRPANGFWYILGSSSGFKQQHFGNHTDQPVPADYDGDGRADYAVYRQGIWYLLNSSSGFAAYQFGTNSDKPVPNYFMP